MRKTLSVLLVLVMLAGIIPFAAVSTSAAATLTRGQIIEFGSYPQSKVTDSSLISALDKISADWVSYNYYASGKISDYMKYKDVTYKGERFRAVTFNDYRPNSTHMGFSAQTSHQPENGYLKYNTYWFRYEPLKWRVLDPDKGLVTCESIIDSQQFYHDNYEDARSRDGENCYANSYKHSDIRKFLTDTFYNLAFTADEKGVTVPTTVNSNEYSSQCSKGNGDVTDRVFLLGWNDVINGDYGFNPSNSNTDKARRAQGTDYAKCQGLLVKTDITSEYYDDSFWWLRTASYVDGKACCISWTGEVYNGKDLGCFDYYGVRPALTLNVKSYFNTVKPGWKKDSKGWYYLNADGSKVQNKWIKDSKGWCYVGADGYIVYNKWVKDSKGWCYCGSDGYIVYNKWVKDSKGWCYCGADGYIVYNKWVKDSKGWCYCGDDGYIVYNKWVKDSKGWCYCGADGYIVYNKWIKDSKGWCYCGADGYIVYNQWVKDSKGWCYVGKDGYQVFDTYAYDSTGKHYIGKDGYMKS